VGCFLDIAAETPLRLQAAPARRHRLARAMHRGAKVGVLHGRRLDEHQAIGVAIGHRPVEISLAVLYPVAVAQLRLCRVHCLGQPPEGARADGGEDLVLVLEIPVGRH